MDRYLGGEDISHDTLTKDLEKAVAHATFHPVVPVCSVSGVGCPELLDLAVDGFPSPLEHASPEVFTPAGGAAEPISGDPRGTARRRGRQDLQRPVRRPGQPRARLLRHAHAGRAGPRVGSLHVVLRPRRQGPTHEDHDEDEKVGSLTYPFGRLHVPAEAVIAGDLAAIGKLSRAETGDTLSSIEEPRVLRPWSMPEPLLPVAIVAKSKADEDKLSQALGRLAAEDPSVRVENNPETHQLVLWTMGEAHADVLIARLADRYSVHVETEPFLVSLRETFGGHGQGPRPARQAVRRPRAVRRVPHRGRAAARGRRVRVRRQGGRRLGAAAVHPVGREGRARPDGARGPRRLPDGRPPGDPHRRQGARCGLLRHGLPDGRVAGAPRGRRRPRS